MSSSIELRIGLSFSMASFDCRNKKTIYFKAILSLLGSSLLGTDTLTSTEGLGLLGDLRRVDGGGTGKGSLYQPN